jgi:hypothetical protein
VKTCLCGEAPTNSSSQRRILSKTRPFKATCEGACPASAWESGLTKRQAKLPGVLFVDERKFDAGEQYVDREVIEAIIATPVASLLELPVKCLISELSANQSCA